MPKLVGYMNGVSSTGNNGVTVCVMDEFTQWDTANRECHGQKVVSEYICGKHMSEGDIGKECILFFKKNSEGKRYCSGIKVL